MTSERGYERVSCEEESNYPIAAECASSIYAKTDLPLGAVKGFFPYAASMHEAGVEERVKLKGGAS